MMHLAWPWLLLCLPLPWLARALLPPAAAVLGAALRLPALQAEAGGVATGTHPHRLERALAWMAWILLVIAAARPQWLGEPVQLPVAGRDLMLAVDVSGSMENPDYVLEGRPVNRLEVVKSVAGRFIARRSGDRIGLILFGSRAYLQTPLTQDKTTVRALLEESVIGLAGRETALGDAIGLAIKRLREREGDNRVLILLTDGTNTAGALEPREAARLAAQVGIRLYTIGIGGKGAGRRGPFGLSRRASDLDSETLKAIAEATGGRYFHALDTDQLEAVYDELDRLEPSLDQARSYRPMQSLYVWPAGAAFGLGLVVVLGRAFSRRG